MTSVARGAEGGRILVLPVAARSAPPAVEARKAEQAVSDVLVGLGFEVTGRDGTDAAPTTSPCDGGACAVEAARAASTAYVAIVRLVSTRKGYSADVAIVAVADGAGREVARERIECGAADLCAPLSETAADAARAAGRRAIAAQSRQPPKQPTGPVANTTGPAGGASGSMTPSMAVPQVSSGTSTTLSDGVTPAPPPDAAVADGRGGWRRWAPWALTGAGVALLATSGALFALHHKEIDCDDGGDRCRNRYSNVPRGIAAGILGVAALGAGVYVWINHAGEGSGGTSIGVSPDGVLVRGVF